jgi:hypothetical protein
MRRFALTTLIFIVLFGPLPFANAEETATPLPGVAAVATPEPTPALEPPVRFRFSDGSTLELYSRFEMLTYYDTTTPYLSDWFVYVQPEGSLDGEEDSFSMSVRASPLGFRYRKPNVLPGADLNARLEVDFTGGFSTGTTGAYSPLVRLKQMWVSLDGEHVSFLAGQTFVLFSPLFPDVGSWVSLGTSGNPWMRLPQLKLTATYQPVKLEFSLARPMGANEIFANSQNDIISDGEKSNLPFSAGRISYSKKRGSVTVTNGFSGMYGREKVRREDAAAGVSVNENLPMWFLGFDCLATSKYAEFSMEGFVGENLNSFFAGVAQGVNVANTTASTIRTIGGWAQIKIKPTEKYYFVAGAGMDNPYNRDLDTATQRSYNYMLYGNANYMLTERWRLSLEPSYLRTGYMDGKDNGDLRMLLLSSWSL